MKRWWADTLFKRLFALMWFALVVSHAVAFLFVTRGTGTPQQWPTLPSLPPFPSTSPQGPSDGAGGDSGPGAGGPDGQTPPDLPRGGPGGPGGPPQFPDNPQRNDVAPGANPANPANGANAGNAGNAANRTNPANNPGNPGNRGMTPPSGRNRVAGPSIGAVLLDYAIRLLIIGLAAWFGARWLSRPMRRLASASRTLGRALASNAQPPQIDERTGTVEVREAAHMFNEMSQQLSEQVQTRALLVAAISHDLRTPLTRIRMRLELTEDDPLTQRSIADIHEMDDLIESALEVFRGGPGHEEQTLAIDARALVQSLADDHADLGQPVTMTAGGPAIVRAQPAALRRVVANLITNALRYGQRAEVHVATRDGRAEIVIDDFGPGIPVEQLEAVMRPFYRLETSRNRLTGGNGLGLYIARDLITRQDGTLTLVNRPEGGLRATISLQAG